MPKKPSPKSKRKTTQKPKLKYASFSKRLWANLIDILILASIAFTAYKIMFSSGNIHQDISFSTNLLEFAAQNPSLNLFLLLISSIMAITYSSLYYLVLWVAGLGQTLGFRIMQIKLIRDDGKRISYPLAYLRFIASIFSCLFLMLGFFYILYNRKSKTWHDYLCHTSVVEE